MEENKNKNNSNSTTTTIAESIEANNKLLIKIMLGLVVF